MSRDKRRQKLFHFCNVPYFTLMAMIYLHSSVPDTTPASLYINATKHTQLLIPFTLLPALTAFYSYFVSSILLFPRPLLNTRPQHSFIYICSRQLCFVSQTAYYRCKISHSYSKFYIPVLPLIYSASTSIYALPAATAGE